MLHNNTTPVYVVENTLLSGLNDFQVVKISTVPTNKISKSFAANIGSGASTTKTTHKRPQQVQEPSKRLALKNETVVVLVVPTTVKKSTNKLPENLSGIAQSETLVALQSNISLYAAASDCVNYTIYALHGYFPPPLKAIIE